MFSCLLHAALVQVHGCPEVSRCGNLPTTFELESDSLTNLADRVLGLHEDICEVYVLEDRAGEHVVVEEAYRKGVTLLANSISGSGMHGLLAPMIIIGSTSQFGGQQSKLVGVEYEKAGLILAPLDENKLLALSTKVESLHDVMQTVSKALLKIKEDAQVPTGAGAVASAAQAENSARYFLAGRYSGGPNRIQFDEVTYRSHDQKWEVHGRHRSWMWGLTERFQVEVDARDGFVKGFTSSSSSTLLIVEIACVLAAAVLALIAFFAKLF
jgi:hypothetical protein